MTKQEKIKEVTKQYIDILKKSNIIEDRYTGKFNIHVDMSNGGIGNISVDKEVCGLLTTYSTLAKTLKVREHFFWEGTD